MTRRAQPLPTMQEVLDYLQNHENLSKRQISRDFHIKGDGHIYLKQLLKEIERKGLLVRQGRRYALKDRLPSHTDVVVVGIDQDGCLLARPVQWTADSPEPTIFITRYQRLHPTPTIGDMLAVKIQPTSKTTYEGEAVRAISAQGSQMVGVWFKGRVLSVDRRFQQAFIPDGAFPPDMKDNDLVEVSVSQSKSARPVAHFVRKLGTGKDAFASSIISIYAHHLPTDFSQAALKEAKKLKTPNIKGREDLRELPFVTVDDATARDFDDAVYVQKQGKGFRVYVAIADVAYFVREGSALDKEALARGNSTYFPDRVLPMLPPMLSNGVCSLNPGEDKACLVAQMDVDASGLLCKSRFVRALIRSHARLTYEEVQAAFDGKRKIAGLEEEIACLHSVYHLLAQQRAQRGVLELDVPEYQVDLTDKGQVRSITQRRRYDSHKMIEELMILANVSAARILESKQAPVMYRVHDEPSLEKVEQLKNYLRDMGIKTRLSARPKAEEFTQLLEQHKGVCGLANMLLRSQSQAKYSPENIGHFGLALSQYAHFTSPIRRYADILVHRALIRALKLGEGGLSETTDFEQIGEHISSTERNSAQAEQDAIDRYVAYFLAQKTGQIFDGVISSVTPFGLFVSLPKYGADGLIPLSHLAGRFEYNEKTQTLRQRNRRVYHIGQKVQVLLKESNPINGGLLFDLI
ncbi:MAG: ribonuclease R [Alphaproteobacteria bacterium]|nr:ribonuclease R [Alphaproteobacteria bacterium]